MVKIIPLIKNNFVFLKISPFKMILKKNKIYDLYYCIFKLINVTFTKPSVREDKIFISFPVSFRNLKS